LDIPLDSELAIKLKTGKAADRAEKAIVKQLTLDMNQRLEEESYQEIVMQAQKTNVVQSNDKRTHRKECTFIEFINFNKAK